MLFEEKKYKESVKYMAEDPAKFSSFLTHFAVDVRSQMEEDDRAVFDFYIDNVFSTAVLSGGDERAMAVAMLKSIFELRASVDKEGVQDEAEHKQD